MNDLFQYATRNKLRFTSSRGELSLEQLWDVPLRSQSGFDLNEIAKGVNAALKAATEESFVETSRSQLHIKLEASLDLVKHVISVKLAEEDAAKKRTSNRQEKEKLLKILAEKQDGKLSALTEKELQDRIAALELT